MVSRSLGVTAATLSAWRDALLAAGKASLASKPATGEALQNERLKARLGEMLLEQELLAAKIALLEAREPTLWLWFPRPQELGRLRARRRMMLRFRSWRTLKDNLLWVRAWARTLELRLALLAFREIDNATWMIKRHGFRPAAAIRREQLPPVAEGHGSSHER